MKSKTSRKPLAESKRISSWDDVVFDPADLVRDMKDLADRYEGKKKLTLRTFTIVASAPKFSPMEIVELREARKLSRPLFARILNVPVVTVRKWESGERMPSGAALRLLEVMRSTPEALLRLALSKTANPIKAGGTAEIEFQSDPAVQDAVELICNGRTSELRSRERKTVSVRRSRRKAKS
jgi:DNA-binding transcriptional regulator YiaG